MILSLHQLKTEFRFDFVSLRGLDFVYLHFVLYSIEVYIRLPISDEVTCNIRRLIAKFSENNSFSFVFAF